MVSIQAVATVAAVVAVMGREVSTLPLVGSIQVEVEVEVVVVAEAEAEAEAVEADVGYLHCYDCYCYLRCYCGYLHCYCYHCDYHCRCYYLHYCFHHHPQTPMTPGRYLYCAARRPRTVLQCNLYERKIYNVSIPTET